MNSFEHFFVRRAFLKARMGIYENLAALLGEVSSRSTETYAQIFTRWSLRDKQRKLDTWKAYQLISKRLQGGMNLSKSMEPFIPSGEAMILRAGEESGKLPEVMKSMVEQSEVLEQVRNEMVGALLEPSIMVVGFLLLSLLFGLSLWPMFDKTIDPNMWDAWVMPMKGFQQWYGVHWWWFSVLLIALIVVVFKSRPVWIGKLRGLADRIPPWSVYRDMQAIQTLVVLGALTRSGLTLDMSLQRLMTGAPRYLKWHLKMMQKRNLSNNASIVNTFSTGLFNDYIVDRVSDAAQSKSFDEVMTYVAGSSLRSIARALVRRAKVINIAGITFVALLFAYLSAVQTIGIQDAVTKYQNFIESGNR